MDCIYDLGAELSVCEQLYRYEQIWHCTEIANQAALKLYFSLQDAQSLKFVEYSFSHHQFIIGQPFFVGML